MAEKKIEKMRKESKVEILALDDTEGEILYFTDEVDTSGNFVRFKPKSCFAKNRFYNMSEMVLILPSTRIKQIVIRQIEGEECKRQ